VAIWVKKAFMFTWQFWREFLVHFVPCPCPLIINLQCSADKTVWEPLILCNRRTKGGTTKDKILRGHYTYEGHTFTLSKQTTKQVAPACGSKN